MTRILPATLGLALAAAGLSAYGVSPAQYSRGQAQDAQAAGGLPVAPAPQPIPMNQLQQPGPQGAAAQTGNFQMPQGAAQPIIGPQPTPDYNALGIPDWAKAWKHYNWTEALDAYNAKDALFIDARAKSEYDQAHIPGAIPMPVGETDKYYKLYEDKIKHAKRLITYCHGVGCQLSNKVAKELWEKYKYRNVGSFFGGWPQWQQHNMPVETGGTPGKR